MSEGLYPSHAQVTLEDEVTSPGHDALVEELEHMRRERSRALQLAKLFRGALRTQRDRIPQLVDENIQLRKALRDLVALIESESEVYEAVQIAKALGGAP